MLSFPIVTFLSDAESFWFGFIIMMLAGVMNGAMTTAVFGMAGFLPFQYMGSIMLG